MKKGYECVYGVCVCVCVFVSVSGSVVEYVCMCGAQMYGFRFRLVVQ